MYIFVPQNDILLQCDHENRENQKYARNIISVQSCARNPLTKPQSVNVAKYYLGKDKFEQMPPPVFLICSM